MVSTGYIAVRGGPLRVNRSVTIAADPASPFPPSFDCLGRSSLLFANASRNASSVVSLSGIRVRNGRSELGGSLHLLAGTVRLHDLTISGSRATLGPGRGQTCASRPLSDDCLQGGGAVHVQANAVSMEGVVVHNATTPLSGGAISILDAQFVHLCDIDVHDAHSRVLGGAIAVASSARTSHRNFNWTICNVATTGTAATSNVGFGGAVSLWASSKVWSSLWSLAHITASNTKAGGNGGAVSLAAANDVSNTTWSVEHVDVTSTTAGFRGGGALSLIATTVDSNSLWSVADVTAADAKSGGGAGGAAVLLTTKDLTNSAWSVARVTATNTTADDSSGGAVSLQIDNDMQNSSWSVAYVTATSTRASYNGGAVTLSAISDVLNSAWSVAHVAATNTVAHVTGGGAVSLSSLKDVVNSTWSVANVTATNSTAGGSGGAVYLVADSVMPSTVWSVVNVTATNTASAGHDGAAVALFANKGVSDSVWSVTHVTAMGTAANSGNGGAVSFAANNGVSSSTWSVAHVAATAASAKRGGVVALKTTTFLNSTFSLSKLQMMASSASAEGGGAYVSVQSAVRSSLSLLDWHVRDLVAPVGAVGKVSHTDAASGERDGLHVEVHRFRVVDARAIQGSGVLAISSGSPHQIPWRKCDVEPGFCPFSLYQSPAVPLAYAIRLDASDWDVDGLAATSGALAALSNVNASFSNILVRQVTVTSSGGLWSLTAYTALSAHNVSATVSRASIGARGLLFDQSESPGNLSLSHVSARLEDGPLLDSGVQTWIHAGALTPSALSSVSIACPPGATFVNTSLGDVQVTESPFSVTEYTDNYRKRAILTAQAFPYAAATLGCSVCPGGKYMLAHLAWVSRDVDGAVCAAGLHADATLPLCHSAPEHKSSCVECPTGATCNGGANVTAQVGRWGTMSPHRADQLIRVFPLLQFGYACSASPCQHRYNSCTGYRAGFACGRCRREFGEVLGSAECVAEAACRDWEHYAAWVAFPLGCTAVAALFLHSADAKSDGVTAGLTTILFVLFQSEAIVRTHDEGKASALSHWSMFQISLPAARVCLWPGMSATAKALVPLGSYIVILAVFGLLYGAHWLLSRRSWVAEPPSSRRHKRALVSLFLVSYGAIANVCLKLVTRTEVDGVWYQSLTGEQWMTTVDQWIALLWLITSTVPTPLWFWFGMSHLRVGTMSDVTFGLGLLFPIPAALWPRLTRRWPLRWEEKQAARDLHHTLAAPYRERFWYWDGVFLAQRLAFGLLSVSLASQLWYRTCAMAGVAVVLALNYARLRVFATSAVDAVHTAALVALLVVCFSNGTMAYTYQHGSEATPDLLAVHRVSTWALWGVLVVAMAAKVIQARRGSKAMGPRCGWRMYKMAPLSWTRPTSELSAPLVQRQE